MTDFINRNYRQTIVFWNASGTNASGNKTFDAPVELIGRWVDKQINFTDNTGEELVSSSVVYFKQDVKAGDWVFLGALTDIPSSVDDTNPNKVTGADEIGGFEKTPTLKANKFLRKALLKSR